MAHNILEKRIEKLESYNEIQNLMGKYVFLLGANRYMEIVDNLFAQKTPDVSADIGDWGVFRGINSVKRLFVDIMGRSPTKEGEGSEHDLASPIIEVAGDGKTAKGVWMSPGFETFPEPETGKVTAGWNWTKYACDFIKEDGKWKIWHFTNILTFYADYDKGWTGGGEHFEALKRVRSLLKQDKYRPDGPPTLRHNPYNPKTKPELIPGIPEPYETYSGEQDWMDPDKPRE